MPHPPRSSWLRSLNLKRWFLRPRGRERRLQLVESLALGERRFVAVLNVDGREFLVGATANSVAVLGELAGSANEFSGAVIFPSAGVQ